MIRTDNDFLIGSNGRTMAPMMPLVITSREQAYRTAAWIKTMAVMLPHEEGDDGPSFEEVEQAIRNT